MNKFLQTFIFLVITFFTSSTLFASDDHGHEGSGHENAIGVHGGEILSDDEFSLEVVLKEDAGSVLIRAWGYYQDELLRPEDIQLSVELARLDGDKQPISFRVDDDSLLSNDVISTPHSFDVTLSAQYKSQISQWQFQNHEGRTIISESAAHAAGLMVEEVGAASLHESVTLYGRIRANGEQVYPLSSRYAGLVQRVNVSEGDKVKKGDVVAIVEARDTLQGISIRSPADGVVTARNVNVGMLVDEDILIEVTNIDTLWLDLDAFPKDLSRLALGQQVLLHDAAERLPIGTLSYIAPGADIHTRSTRIRALIENPDATLRPGTLVRADIVVSEKDVPIAVKRTATQDYQGNVVVFIQVGDAYEARTIDVGMSDGEWVEVLGGLAPGTFYVTENSFLVKADILKSGASHQH